MTQTKPNSPVNALERDGADQEKDTRPMAHHGRTPQSILDAPGPHRVVIWPCSSGPFTSSKVRKVRRGRKARWNR